MRAIRSSLRSLLPAPLRGWLADQLEWLPRVFPGKARGIPGLGLSLTQVYPAGVNFHSVIAQAIAVRMQALGLGPSTPIASIGTCFAEEFAFFMQARGLNYVRVEADAFAASANWGRVYTIPNFLQIVRYSVEDDFPILIEQSEKGFFDPLREYSVAGFATRQSAEAGIRAHRKQSRLALKSCSVLVLTVGQNEAWVDRRSGMVWGRIPPKSIMECRQDDFEVREFTYAENLRVLEQAVALLREINPAVRILITVSPVPSQATFSDADVISRSFSNKCLLRAVVEEAVKIAPDRLFYFPSFEMVLCYNPESFRADNRHVKRATVARIFSLLEKTTGLSKTHSPPGA